MVSRLCEPIDGLDSAQIALCLGSCVCACACASDCVCVCTGMDPSGFRGGVKGEGEGEVREGREESYADCQLPSLTCPSCAKLVSVAGATVSRSL